MPSTAKLLELVTFIVIVVVVVIVARPFFSDFDDDNCFAENDIEKKVRF